MRRVLLLATLALLAPPARAQQQQQPVAAETGVAVPDSGPIAKVEIKGNRRVETDAIKAVLPLKPGDTYDKTKLKNTLLAVWKMGYFSDVQLDVSPSTPPLTGYTLTVIVSEKPAVREIKLEGNEELSKDDFKDTIEIKQFQILDMESVRKAAKKMQEKYVEKGYFLAEVTPAIRRLRNNDVDVAFVINQHANVPVRELRFAGHKALSTQRLKPPVLTTQLTLF